MKVGVNNQILVNSRTTAIMLHPFQDSFQLELTYPLVQVNFLILIVRNVYMVLLLRRFNFLLCEIHFLFS